MGWTAPRTYVAGEVLTAAIFNTDHRDNLLTLGGPWTPYTPTWTATTTNPAIVNGTLTARAAVAGKTFDVGITIVMGSGTTYGSGIYFFTLPAGSVLQSVNAALNGAGIFVDASAGSRYQLLPFVSTTSAIGLMLPAVNQYLTNVNPVTVATGDILEFAIRGEAA